MALSFEADRRPDGTPVAIRIGGGDGTLLEVTATGSGGLALHTLASAETVSPKPEPEPACAAPDAPAGPRVIAPPSATRRAAGGVSLSFALSAPVTATVLWREPGGTWAALPSETSTDYARHAQTIASYPASRDDVEIAVKGEDADGNAYAIGPAVHKIKDPAPAATGPSAEPAAEPAAAPDDYARPSRFAMTQLTRNGADGYQWRHWYSRARAFNVGEARVVLGGGQGRIVGLDGSTLLAAVGGRDWKWSQFDPDVLFRCNADRVESLDYSGGLNGGVVRTLWTLPGGGVASIGAAEGAIQLDRFAVVDRYRTNPTLYSVDLANGKPLGTLPVPEGYDWAGFCKSGAYIVVRSKPGGKRRMTRYNPDFSGEAVILNDGQHADFVIDAAGDDWLVIVGPLRAVRIKDGLVRDLGEYQFGHLSGLADAPGRVWFAGSSELCEMSIEPGEGWATRRTWGLHGTNQTPYPSQAQVTVSPSGRRILFTSSQGGGPLPEEYIISGS